MLGAVNSIAALLGTADRSTNIELVTCVNSGFCGASVLPGATDPVTAEEQETVITTMHVPAATANSLRRLAPPTTTSSPTPSWPARAWPLTADRSRVVVEYRVVAGRMASRRANRLSVAGRTVCTSAQHCGRSCAEVGVFWR